MSKDVVRLAPRPLGVSSAAAFTGQRTRLELLLLQQADKLKAELAAKEETLLIVEAHLRQAREAHDAERVARLQAEARAESAEAAICNTQTGPAREAQLRKRVRELRRAMEKAEARAEKAEAAWAAAEDKARAARAEAAAARSYAVSWQRKAQGKS